jgi:acetoin utilization deacetylase AcuC-like enzyme
MERDGLVMETALKHAVPVAIVTAGGYALDVRDTVTIHVNTAKAAKAALSNS